jgi:hypothetical protein
LISFHPNSSLLIPSRSGEAAEQRKAAFWQRCGDRLDCLSWCNDGNCQQCPCAQCEPHGSHSARTRTLYYYNL